MQKVLSCLFLVLSVFWISGFITKVYAQEYKIVPYIAVPADKQVDFPQDQLTTRFSPVIQKSLQDIQQYYAKQLDGGTFQIDSIQSVVLPGSMEATSSETNLCNVFSSLKGYSAIRPTIYTIPVVWIIGSGDGANCTEGTQSGKIIDLEAQYDLHVVSLSHVNLLNLTDQGSTAHDEALSILAHELGHAFGLAYGGFAKGHTCSQASLPYCKSNTTTNIPDREEGLSDIMYFSIMNDRKLQDKIFHNTVYNPEIVALYQNPFINPQKKESPRPKEDETNAGVFITGLTPTVVTPGDEIKIKGVNFGDGKGKILLQNLNYMTSTLDAVSIKEWKSGEIIMSVTKNPYGEDTNWNIIVENAQKVQSNDFTITLKGNPAVKTPNVQQVAFRTVCGTDNNMLSGASVSLIDESGKIFLSTKSTVSIQTLAYISQSGKRYALRAFGVESIMPNPDVLFIEDTGDPEKIPLYTFSYPSCPSQKLLALQSSDRDITSITVDGNVWENFTEENAFFDYSLPINAEKGGYSLPINVYFSKGEPKEFWYTFWYDPTPPTPTPNPQGNPGTDPGEEGPEEGSEVEIAPGQKANVCSYEEEFPIGDEEEFKTCSKGVRKCKGIKNGNSCEYNAEVTKRNQCKVVSCEDEDYTPEPTQPGSVRPTDSDDNPGACERDTFFECANECNSKGQPYEIWGCKDGTNKKKDLNHYEGWENSLCAQKCPRKSNTCERKHYYDPNAEPDGVEPHPEKGVCIYKRPLEDNPSECSYDHVDYRECE